jgi:hypothetical protein
MLQFPSFQYQISTWRLEKDTEDVISGWMKDSGRKNKELIKNMHDRGRKECAVSWWRWLLLLETKGSAARDFNFILFYFWKKKIIYLVVDLSFTFSLDEGENEFSIKNIIYPIHRELKQTINILFWEKLLKIVH